MIQRLAVARTVVAVTHRPELLTVAEQHIELAPRPTSNLVEALR
jgi:DNA repair ATPase RecN